LNQIVDFHEIQLGVNTIEDDLDAIIFNHIDLTILKWRTFKLLRWMQNLHQSTLDYQGLSLVTMVTRPLLCGSGSNICAAVVIVPIVTIVGDVTMETKVHSLL
jgi:hypothetical protein